MDETKLSERLEYKSSLSYGEGYVDDDDIAQALALEAEVERWKKAARSLYNEAEMQVQESYPILFYDVVAMAFYRATGIWPLGKSSPIGMYHELSDEERFNAFQEWLKALAQTGKSDG